MANPENLKPFKRGDARINRLGRPKNFDALRTLTQQIAHEPVTHNGAPVVVAGHALTCVEAILRQWAHSKNARLQMAFVEIAYGKTPDKVEVSGNDGEIPIKIKMVWGDTGMAETPDAHPDPHRIDYRKNLHHLAPLDDE